MKNQLIILTFLIVLHLGCLHAQVSQKWDAKYNGPANYNDIANSVVVDNSGYIYVTGYSAGSGTVFDYATIKYNSSGIQQWVRRYNGTGNNADYARSMAVDGSGNIYVTGASDGIGTDGDYLTIKYNSNGDSLWVKRYDGPNSSGDEALSVAVDGLGNVYVTGNSYGIGTQTDYATIKYNSSGVQQWVKRYNGPGNYSDYAVSLKVDGSGNVYVTGYSTGMGTEYDYTTIKYNSNGDSLWVKRYNGPGNNHDYANAIALDVSGNVYITGGSSHTTFGTEDFATVKYNTNGVQQWVKRYGKPGNDQDIVSSIAIDGSGNIYITGQSVGNGSDFDYATIKYNSNGDSLWVKRYNGINNSSDSPTSLAVDGSGNSYVTGASSGISGYDYATIKFNSSGVQQWIKNYNAATGFNSDVAVDNSGNVFITGAVYNVESFQYDYLTINYSQNPYALITGFIEGFYNSISNKMLSDTARVYLRNTVSPFAIVDSSKSKLDSSGNGRFYFSNVTNAVNYYIVMKHRNSIETWSNFGYSFSSGVLTYNFSNSANKAYGNNQTQIDNSPVRYGIYSGDVNQDGAVDLTDGSLIDNDSYNFVNGYVVTDLNGDNTIDLSDAAIADDNAFNFVSKITP
ncbi:MAG: SBBP repeat-containing protein [Bacteroidota bacterium]|nr:SBBP repeat-containing protein [Bacteroidota bacterium]